MTDKLKLFKVRLASGAERYIVAPDLVAVAQLTFERPASGSISAGVDPVKGVEEDVDVDFVVLREPVPETAAPGETPEVQVAPPTGWREHTPAELAKLQAKPRSSPPFGVGDVCPECGSMLHATLGQLVCSLGHQVGPVPEGTFHAHAESLGPRPWCKACQREGRIPQRETLGG